MTQILADHRKTTLEEDTFLRFLIAFSQKNALTIQKKVSNIVIIDAF